nr:reverse transcriptase domain-containing protein [Tanacetum cinerariifolium]
MHTRNSYYPNNSSVTIPRRRNKRHTPNIVELELRTIVEMANNLTMAELIQAPMEGYREAIFIPKINADHFEIKTNLLQLVQANPYHGFERENPHTHINNFKWITLTLKFWDVIKLMMFPYSLEGSARVWHDKEPPNSILTWEDLEKFGEACEQYKKMLRACPHHGFTELDQIDTFYNGLNDNDQDSLNATAGGNILSKTTREALQIIENKSKVRYSRNKPNVSRMNTTSRENASKTNDRINKLADQISTLVDIFAKKVVTPAPIKAVEESCVTCGGPHAHYNCNATNSNQPSICVAISTYNQVALQNCASNYMAPPGFAPSLLTNKDNLFEFEKIPLNENYSTMLLKKLPKKLGDPGKFLITCELWRMDVCHALADLGASINIMLLSIWKKLSLPKLTPTRMTLELADRSITRPKGVAEDVFVKERKFHFSTDFVVVDFVADPRVPLILGRSFLRTGHLKHGEVVKAKSSIEEPSELELKDLPSHLEYAYLEGVDKLPVIIAKDSKVDEKEALLKVLKSHKKAIASKITKIKGIDPQFCTHKILMEENYKPTVKSQRRVNSKIHEVIKKEVIKLLNAEIIYLIFDSPLVSPICCVPKKGGITIVENENNELIPTRIVYTDHSALKYLLSKQDAKPMLIWWVLILQEFDIIICDKKGTENLVADHLSRLENPHKDVFENKDINENFPLETLEAKQLPTNDARVVVKFLKSFFARFETPRAVISDRMTHFCNDNFAKVMSKYGVTHRLATAYHPQTSGLVEVSNRGLKRILERTTPIECTPYKLVYGKSCHLPIELEHKAYWALKHVNFDLKTTGDHRKLQLNELRDQAYVNSLIYKEKTKKLHDSKIKNRIFNVGDRVLFFNSRLKIFSRKLKTHWS